MAKFNILHCPKINEYGSRYGSTALHFPAVKISNQKLKDYDCGNFVKNLGYDENPDPDKYTSLEDLWSQYNYKEVSSFEEAYEYYWSD